MTHRFIQINSKIFTKNSLEVFVCSLMMNIKICLNLISFVRLFLIQLVFRCFRCFSFVISICKNKFVVLILATSSSSFSSADKTHRRSPSGGNQLDRPGAPPPQPPPPSSSSSSNLVSSSNVQWRQHQSLPVTNHDEQTNLNSPVEEKLDSPSNVTTPTNENVNVGKLISELNNRMAAARGNNQIPPNNIRASSFRNSNLNSPGETTDF